MNAGWTHLPAPLGPDRYPPAPGPFAGGPADAGRCTEGAVPRQGVVLTRPDGGSLRLSMPGMPLRGEEIDLLALLQTPHGNGKSSVNGVTEASPRSPERMTVVRERSAAVTSNVEVGPGGAGHVRPRRPGRDGRRPVTT